MAYFIHDGLSFYYEEHGTGPTLIFSHGLGGSSASTRELVVGLAGIRTILYDNRFHGLTNPLRDPGKLNFDQMAAGALLVGYRASVEFTADPAETAADLPLTGNNPGQIMGHF